MQLDDVGKSHSVILSMYANTRTVSSLTTGPRVEEAMSRSIRWLDRCIAVHKASGKVNQQNLFAIVQGGLDHSLRDKCLDDMISRKDEVAGYAIGGLSGGEEKGKSLRNYFSVESDSFADIFWKMCAQIPSLRIP